MLDEAPVPVKLRKTSVWATLLGGAFALFLMALIVVNAADLMEIVGWLGSGKYRAGSEWRRPGALEAWFFCAGGMCLTGALYDRVSNGRSKKVGWFLVALGAGGMLFGAVRYLTASA